MLRFIEFGWACHGALVLRVVLLARESKGAGIKGADPFDCLYNAVRSRPSRSIMTLSCSHVVTIAGGD